MSTAKQITTARKALQEVQKYLATRKDSFRYTHAYRIETDLVFTNLDITSTHAIDLVAAACPGLKLKAETPTRVQIQGQKEQEGAQGSQDGPELAGADKIHKALVEDISGLSLEDAAEIIRVIQALRSGDEKEAKRIAAQATETVQFYTLKEWEE